ncbi:MAG: hypothetical protein OSA83_00225 [Pseudomonadales bacterium]|nr:hypothetical protein [Pseudomonadales bacterium]
MPNTDDLTGWLVTPDDDKLHNDFEGADHEWWTETFWTSFYVPERKMGGWFYNQVQKNRGEHGMCNGGAWVWDDSEASALYERFDHDLPLAAGPHDLRDIQLPNRNHIRMIEPLMKYQVIYSDPGKFEADLTFEGIMAPNPHPDRCAPFWKGRHFDQPMHVTGNIVLQGEDIPVDCFAFRDRSWSPRRPRDSAAAQVTTEGKKPQADSATSSEHSDVSRPLHKPWNLGYILATAGPRDAFLVYTMLISGEEDRGDFTNTGFLLRDGVWAHLVEGQRECQVDPDTGCVWRIEYEGVDTLGRKIHAIGEQVSNHGTGTSMMCWRWDGLEGWGENQGGIAPTYARVKRS